MRHKHSRSEVLAQSGREFARRDQSPKRKRGVKSGKRGASPKEPVAPYTVPTCPRQCAVVLTVLLVVTGLQSAAAQAEFPFSAQIVFGYGEAPPARIRT